MIGINFLNDYEGQRVAPGSKLAGPVRRQRRAGVVPRRQPKSCSTCRNYGMVIRDGYKELCPEGCAAAREMIG